MNTRLKRGLFGGSLLLLIGICTIVYLFHSHSTDSHLKLIPKDATVILKINIKELASKADLVKLMAMPAFKNPSSGKTSINQLLSNPFASGIDPLENIYGFIAKEDEATVTAIVFKVADKSNLSSFLSQLGISKTPEEVSGIYFSEIDENRCIAWNDDAGILLSINEGDKKTIALKYLTQAKTASILVNNSYKLFSEKTFDVGLFIDNKILSQMGGSGNSLSSFGITNGHGEVLVNFENDKISTRYSNYPENANSTSILKKNGSEANHFSAIAPQTPLVYFSIASDINSLFSILGNNPEMKNNLDYFETYIELSDADTRKLLNGDASIAFTDFKDISTYDPRIKAQLENMIKNYGDNVKSELALAVPMAYISVGINDDNKINSILEKSGMQKTGDFYELPGLNLIVYACAKNGNLFITNDYYGAESFSKSGKFSTPIPSEISKTNPCLIWADLNQKHFPSTFVHALNDNYDQQTVNFFLSALQPFQSLKMESRETGAQLDFLLNAGEGNSLYRLLSYYGSLVN